MALEVEDPGAQGDDPAADALDGIAATAEEVADEQHEVARAARSLAERRRGGATWTELVDTRSPLVLVDLLRHSAGLLLGAARALQGALARALAREGCTTREIGTRFGVSHQRISALMSRRADCNGTLWLTSAAPWLPPTNGEGPARSPGGPPNGLESPGTLGRPGAQSARRPARP